MSEPADLHRIFGRALAEPPARRAAFVARECAGDPALRARVERLLGLAGRDDGFLDRSPLLADAGPPAASAYEAGRDVGAYRLVRRIGRGGTAEVWLAERREGGFRRQVAVKLIGHGSGVLGQRFDAERGILAALVHPGIARLYDGGATPGGGAYMAMEYVEGDHLVAWCRARGLPLGERLALFLQVCDAVAYAHAALVVHRDIKPANILVTGDGQAKLLDFGIARLLGEEPARDATRTLQLSPAYAAPEQLAGRPAGTATDVYALGVTLFELVAERLPWRGSAAPLETAIERLLDAPPPPPSRLAAADAPVPPRALRGDIDAIVGKALRRNAAERYPDARALADDIRRHLAHEPVHARAGARAYVLRRFLRRHWLALAAAAAAFLAMSATIAGVAWQAKKARIEAQRAAAVQAFMVDLFRRNGARQSDPLAARRTTARELLGRGAERIRNGLDQAPENRLALLRLFADLYDEFALSSDQRPLREQAAALSRQLYGDRSTELAGDLVALAEVTTDPDAAERLLAEARAIFDRRGETRSFLRGRLLVASAGHHYTSDLRRARAEAGAAVAVLDAFAPSAELARALYFQGTTTSYAGDAAAALAPLRRSVEVSIAAQGAPNPMLSTYYRQLGETESYAGQHAAAEASVRQALAAAHADAAEYDYDRVRAETTMALVLVNADRPLESLEPAARAKADAPPETADGAVYLRTFVFHIGSRTQVRAGEPGGALADAETAERLARGFDPHGTVLIVALQRRAEALVELGRTAEATRVLDETDDLLRRAGNAPSRFDAMLRIRAALDDGRREEARTGFAALAPGGADTPAARGAAIRRDLLGAEIELDDGDHEAAARSAAAATARARDGELAPYQRSAIADGQMLEGLARLRGGDPGRARPLLAGALAARAKLYLPQSPRIAEAELALAECELAFGRHAEAARLVAAAEAIERRHASLAGRYRVPLERLRARLGGR